MGKTQRLQRTLSPLALVLGFGMAGCGSGPSPLHDGLTLVFDAPASGECRLSFSASGRDYRVSLSGPGGCPLRPDGLGEEWILDASTEHEGRPVWWGELTGEFGPIWLPPKFREVGNHRFGPAVPIVETATWEGREVAVMLQTLGPLGVRTYYDLESGFLAGVEKRFGGGWNRILVLKRIE